MISLRNVTLQRGAKRLLEGASVTLFAGQKVGITGPNGSGKSSLLALLRDELHAEAGDVEIQPGLTVAWVGQEMPAGDTPALEHALAGDRELMEIERELAQAEDAHAAVRVGELHERLAAIGGYSARARAAQILNGLGFTAADLTRPVSEFSGGWRMRLNLAQALMTRSDVLMLDEPTNHLDLDAILWLEEWLSRYPGTLLLISHDRELLDNTVQHVCNVENRTLRLYRGNYTDFERARAESLSQQQSAYERQQRQIAHMQSFVDRFRAKATKARQAQSRLKALERLERVAAAQVDSPFTFEFREPVHAPQILLTLEQMEAGYPGRTVLADIQLTLRAGTRLGLLGANGAGKSTLVKTLAGEIPPLSGTRTEGRGLAIGYFAQHQLEQLHPESSPLEHLIRIDRQAREQDLRNYLGGFNFGADMVDAPVERFSGGEKSRLTLALLIWQRPNLLLLDEPTNHLDLATREALTIALQDFAGAVVLVSHDRHLLRATADDFVIVADGRLAPFDGDLDDYRTWLAERRRSAEPAAEAPAAATPDRKQQRRAEAEERNRLAAKRRPLEQRLKAVEAEIATLTAEKNRLETLMADPHFYGNSDGELVKSSLKEQGRVAARLEEVEEQWLELQQALEDMATDRA
jgi:ATP-binding cassette subfamily F protein 3